MNTRNVNEAGSVKAKVKAAKPRPRSCYQGQRQDQGGLLNVITQSTPSLCEIVIFVKARTLNVKD